MRLAFVVPRYGPDIVGGAERLCRDYAEHLVASGHHAEVLTTCARNHFTWRNELRPGATMINGVPVHRYPVTQRREYTTMTVLHARMDAGFPLDAKGERQWVENTGYSEPLLEAVGTVADRVDAVMFMPYLFASTVFGARRRPERSLIVPCLHDEAYARFRLIQDTMRSAAGLLFNTDVERDLTARLLGTLPPHRVVGPVCDEPPALDPARWRRDRGLEGELVGHAGRKEQAKNFPLLVEWIAAYDQGLSADGRVTLVVAGSGSVRLPRSGRAVVHDLGFVSETEKLEAFAASVAVAQLSLNESFSYVVMEGWLAGTPLLVHAGCEVTRRHCEESGGGLWVRSAEEFAAALDRVRGDAGLRTRMAAAGERYVRARYFWPAVQRRLESAVRDLLA